MTPEELRKRAEQCDQRGVELARKRDTLAAADAFEEAIGLRKAADELEARLSQSPGRATTGRMTGSARRRMSEASGSENPLVEVANAAGHTLVTLSEAVAKRTKTRFSHAILSKAPRGLRPVREDVTKIVQELTRSEKYPDGYEPTSRNWRGGIK